MRIECRHELSVQSEASCGTLIEAANHQFGFRLGVAVAKRHVSNCLCIRQTALRTDSGYILAVNAIAPSFMTQFLGLLILCAYYTLL